MSDRQRDVRKLKRFSLRKYFLGLSYGGESKNYQFNIEIFSDRLGG